MIRRLLLGGLAALMLAGQAMAQQGSSSNPTRTLDMSGPDGSISNNAAFAGAVAMVANTPATAARSIGANCTVSGNLNLTFSDASTLTVPVGVGWQTFPFAVTQWNSASTTATCSVVELK